MSEHETDPMDDYGFRIGRELHALGERGLQPFDAGAIAQEVAGGRPLGMPRSALGWVAVRAPRWLFLVLVALATSILLVLWVTVGQRPAPTTFMPGSIAFTRGHALYVAVDGGDEVMVAPGDQLDQINNYSFAPDREVLAFSRDDTALGGDDNPGAVDLVDLVVLAPDGHPLGSRAFDDWDAAGWFSWAPRGGQLVIALGADRPELTVVGLDGSTVRTLQLPDGFTWGWLPDLGSWSPDGRWIALFGCIQPCDIKFDPHILLVRADGSGWHWLTTKSDMTGYTTREVWSPDSRLTLANGATGSIEILATDGSTEQQSFVPGLEGTPAWSPDGTRLAVGGRTLTVVESDGTVRAVAIDRAAPEPTVGDDRPSHIGDVGWSADGADLLFVGRADASPVRSLYAIDPQGGTPRLLIEGVDQGFDVATP